MTRAGRRTRRRIIPAAGEPGRARCAAGPQLRQADAGTALVPIFHRRWTTPVLAELWTARGAKFVTLTQRLGVGRSVLRQTLDEAIARGWVVANPGYGHPLRPEFLLADGAAQLGRACAQLVGQLDELKAGEVAGRKWTMPTLAVIGRGRWRFGQLRARLGRVTDRALSAALRDLAGAQLIDRRVVPRSPPSAEYTIAGGDRLLGPLMRVASAV